MDNGVISQAESDEKIFTFDAPDEALERRWWRCSCADLGVVH